MLHHLDFHNLAFIEQEANHTNPLRHDNNIYVHVSYGTVTVQKYVLVEWKLLC